MPLMILATPLKSHSNKDQCKAYKSLFYPLLLAGFKPELHILDNEASHFIQDFSSAGIIYQLAPPFIHQYNAAECAICTFKNQFIAGLATTDKFFSIHLWDQLIPQAVLSLNLLCCSKTNPNLSVHTQLFRQFDFNATPLAPPGT